jgi:hypothetical protein
VPPSRRSRASASPTRTHRLGPPHPGAALPLRRVGRREGPRGADRRRRRSSPPPRHAGGPHLAPRARRARAQPGALRPRLPALHRPDAARRAGRDAGDRRGRRRQRSAAGGLHARGRLAADSRRAAALAHRADRGRARRPLPARGRCVQAPIRFSPYAASRAGGAIPGLAEAEASCAQASPLGNARPEDLALEIAHLLRPGHAITGEIRNVDGGYHILAASRGSAG